VPRAAAPPTTRRVLGVDPGTRIAGWGVVEARGSSRLCVAAGAVHLREPSVERRLAELHRALAEVIAAHSPSEVAVERPFFGKNAASALTVGMARGVALLAAAEADLPVHEYPPATVKRAVVGRGAASKQQVAAMVRVLLGLRETPSPADVTDALAVALAHVQRSGGANLVARS